MGGRRRRPDAGLAGVALALALVLTACGSSQGPTSPGTSGSPGSSSSGSMAPSTSMSPSSSTSEPPSVPPSGSPSATATVRPTANAFWTVVRAGLASAGHLVLTAKGASPVVLRFLPKASEALVAGDAVSICVGDASYQGGGGHFADVPGTWICGADALVTGFRATGGPIDAWNPDFPPGGSVTEKVAATTDGRWRWTFAGRGTLEGDVDGSLLLDPTTQRLIGGTRTGELGKTTYSFDYSTPVAPIVKPAV